MEARRRKANPKASDIHTLIDALIDWEAPSI